MTKLIVIGLVLVAAAAVGTFALQDKAKIEQLEKSKDRGKLAWYAAMAKAKGQQEVVIGAPVVTYAVPKDLEEALAYYSLVAVELLERRSYVEDDETTIKSWYKFMLLEELSSPTIRCTTCPDIELAPKDFLPLQNRRIPYLKI